MADDIVRDAGSDRVAETVRRALLADCPELLLDRAEQLGQLERFPYVSVRAETLADLAHVRMSAQQHDPAA